MLTGWYRNLLRASLLLAFLSFALTGDLTAEQFKFLFLGTARPIVLEVSFDDTSISIDQTRRKYSDGVFARLDLDKDGLLSPDEAELIPADGHLQAGAATIGLDWEDVDAEPRDGKVSATELFAFIDSKLGPRMTVRKFVKQQQTVRLYEDLDLNRDASIDQQEVTVGLSRLRAFDFDDDETLSVAELQPFPRAVLQAQQQTTMADEPLPLLVLDQEESIKTAAERILTMYGNKSGSLPLLKNAELLKVREAIFKRFDADKDGGWNTDELSRYLKLIPGEVVLQVVLTKRSVSLAGSRNVQADPKEGIELGGTMVKCRASNRADMRTNLVNLLKVFALQADADKNRYLDESEFAAFQGMAQAEVSVGFTFQAVDLDGNQQVTSQEIGDFFSLDTLYSQSRLEATLSDDAITLFDIIDGAEAGARDRRLSLRDFQEGAARLARYDANGDGALAAGEIVSEMLLSFGQPQIINYGARAAPPQPNAQQMNSPRQLSGPLWFRRMDRNQDADLTWGEFLGPREDFDHIDLDRDGFITLEEAEAGGTPSAPAAAR